MKRWIPFLALLMLSGCLAASGSGTVAVTVELGGSSSTLTLSSTTTVNDALRQAGITLEELDRVEPPGYTQVADGMVIRVIRVFEELAVIEEPIPFESLTTYSDGLPAGETRLIQGGINGVAEITYRITYENGSEVARYEIRRVVISRPQDEIFLVGNQTELPTVTVNGTLVYISDSNAWVMRQNSANRRPLTFEGGIDGRIFELSGDGKRLLFSRTVDGLEAGDSAAGIDDAPFNQLWVVLDTTDIASRPIPLDLYNVLYADWVPETKRTIVYSTAEPRPGFPGWQANNDLWRGIIADNGRVGRAEQLLEPSSGGIYGWYGTAFAYGPDGVTMAWAQPDAVGILTPIYLPPVVEDETDEEDEVEETPEPTSESENEDEDEEEEFGLIPEPTPENVPDVLLPGAYARQTLLTFSPRNAYDFVWRPDVFWSPDGSVIATTTHGPPVGSESPEDSPLFNLMALAVDGRFAAELEEEVGMWASPQYSPAVSPDGTAIDVRIAYLQAIDPLDSVISRYRLAVMDRDGSNSRVIFPPEGQPGLHPQVITWSPDGRQIALVYQGNLYLIDLASGIARQITGDGRSSTPRWTSESATPP
jgi:hypothetical protein